MSSKEIPDGLIDQLLVGHEGPEAITGPDGLLKHLTKRVVERAMSAELSDHLATSSATSRLRASRIGGTGRRRRR